MKRTGKIRILGGQTAWVLAFLLACSPAVTDGEKITDFQLKDLNGVTTQTAEVRKGKVTILKFGATWCGWCNRQIPELKKVTEAYKAAPVVIIEVDVGEPAATVKAHAEKHGVKHLILLDPEGTVSKQYGVEGIPLVIVAGADGVILYKGAYTPFESLKPFIDRGLAALK